MAASIGTLVFETKLSRSGLDAGLRDIAGTRASIDVDFNFDDRSMARMEQRLKGMNLGLKVTVDDRALTDLNRHLSMKEEHFDRVQRKFNQSPLTPKVDLSQLKELDAVMGRLKDVQINVRLAGGAKTELKALADAVGQIADVKVDAKVTVDRTALDNIKDKTVTVKADTAGLIKSISDAAKQDYQAKIRAKVEVDRAAFDAVKPKTVGIKAVVDPVENIQVKAGVKVDRSALDALSLTEVDIKAKARLEGLASVLAGIADIKDRLAALDESKDIRVSARVDVDRAELDALTGKTIKINAETSGPQADLIDTEKLSADLSKSIGGAVSSGFKAAKSGDLIGVITAPIKGLLGVLGSIGGTVGSGLVLGLTQEVTKGLGKGLGNALEGAIAPAFGSSELLAEKAGGAIAGAIVDGFKGEIAALNGLIDQQIAKIQDKTKREEVQEKVDKVRSAPVQAVQAAQATIGQGEIDRQNLIRQNAQQRERGRGDRQVSSQALTNYREADAQVRDITPRAQAQFASLDQRELSAVVGFKVNREAAEKAQAAVDAFNLKIEKRVQEIQKQIVAASSIRDRATDPAKAEAAAQIALDLAKKIETIKSDPVSAQQLNQLVEAQERAAAPFLAQIGELEQIARDREIVGRALSEAQDTAAQAKAKLEGLGGVFAQTEAVGSVRTATANFEKIKTSGTAQIEQLQAQVEQRRSRLNDLQQNFDQADSQLNAFVGDYTQQRTRLESQIDQASSEGDIKGADALRSRLDALDNNAQAGAVLDLLAEGVDAAEAPLKRELAAIDVLEKQIAAIDGAISAAGEDVAMAQRRLGSLQKDVRPRQYTDIARAVAGPDVDERRLPRIEVDDKTLDSLGANAGYNPRNNTITVRKNLAEALKRSQLSDEQILTLSEELSHAYDVDFGSERGLQASANRTVLADRRLTPTAAEIEAVAPDVSRYAPDRREIELNGKVRANRAATEVISKRDSQAVLDRLGDVRKSLDVSGLAAQLTNLAKQAKAVGLNPQELLGTEAAKIQGISALIDPTVAKVASGALSGSALESSLELLSGKMAGIQSALDDRAKQIAEITQDKAFADFAMGDAFETPDLPEGFTQRMIDRASQGDRRQTERQDSPLDELRVTPRRTAFFSPDPRAYEFEDAVQTRKRENAERVAARREQFKQDVVGGLKAAPGKVKDLVFNPDRNIDINVDAIRENLEATGMAIYKGGLLAAKAMDATADTFRQLAESPLGQMMLSSAADAGQAIGGVAIASYKLASGIEALTLDLIPAGRTLKGALKQTAVPALAFGAATQFIPGGQALAGGAVDLAQAALGPIGQSVAGSLGGQAADALSFLPDAFGLQATITEGIQSLFSGSAGAITSGLAEAAVPILGGKAITTAASRVLPIEGTTNQRALPPSREPFQLPFQAKKIEKPIEVEIAGVNEAKLPPPKPAPQIGGSSAKSAEPSGGGASALSIAVPSRAMAPKPNTDRAVAEASAAARRAGEIAASVVGTARTLSRTTGDVVESAKEIQQRVSEGYKALQGAIKRGDKGLARALQSSIVSTSDQAQKDLDSLIEQAKESGDRKTVSDLGGVKGRINSNLNRTQKLGSKIDAIDVQAIDVPSEGLARASVGTGPSLIQRASNRLKSLLPLNEKRLAKAQVNFDSIVEEVYSFSEAVGGLSDAPKLRVSDGQLAQLGADALYETQTNTILITKELASILEMPPKELAKYADKLQAVVHEARHAAQTSGGAFNIDNAAQGINVALKDASELTPREAIQARASTRAYAGTADRKNVFKLEADAAIFERETPKILDNARVRTESAIDALPKRPLSKVGKQLADLRDAAENAVGNAIDGVRLRLTGQQELIPQARADRLQKRVANINRRENETVVARADAAIDEIGTRQTDTDTAKVQRDNTRSAREVQALQRKVEKQFDLPREADRDIILGDGASEPGAIKSAIGALRSGLKSVNDAVVERLRAQAKEVAADAKTTLTDIRTNRLEAESKAVDNPAFADRAKRLGRLERRTETAVAGIDELTGKEDLGRRDRARLSNLKAEVASVYKEIGKPLPAGSNSLLEIGDKIGGLIGRFKALGIALLALPFAFEALQGLKQFGRDSIDAAVNADRLRTSLAFSTGSQAKGDKALSFVAEQSDTFGVSLRSSREGFAQLKAATKGSKIEGAQTDELFTGFSQASTTLGISGEAQNRAFTALQQIASKGKLSAEELRGQLSEALPGSFAIAARSIGVTETELNKLLETGAIVSDEFLPKFAKQLKSEFGAGAEDASKNLQSSLFRLDNAFLGLQEASGKAISPLVQTGAQAATGALNLLSKSIGIIGPLLAGLGVQAILSFGKELLKIPAIAEKVAGAGGIIKGGFASFAGAIGPTVALTGAAIVAGKVFEGLQETFAIDPAVERFKKNSASISNEMDKLVGKAKKTGDIFKGLGNPENKGLDVTFGLGDALGTGKVKTDDLIDQVNKKPENIGDVLKSRAVAFAGGPLVQAAAALGFKFSEFQKKREKEADEQALKDTDNVIATGGEEKSSQLRLDSLKKAKEIDDKSAALRSELARIKGTPGQEGRATQIQDELKTLGADRKSALVDAEGQAEQTKAALREVEERRKQLAEKPASQERNDGLKQLDDRASKLRERIQQFRDEEIKIGVNVDPIRKMITALADLDDKLSTIQAKADLKLNITLAGNAQSALEGFSTNQFADQDKAIADAKAQADRAAEVFDQSQTAIEATKKELGGEDITRTLSQIGVGSTGRTLSIDSSEEDLKTAKKGATEQEKELIDRVDNFRQAREKLPVLDREKSESALQRKQAEQAGSLARLDDQSQVRDLGNAKSAGDRQVALNKSIASNSFKSDEDLAVKRAEIEKQSVQERASAIQERISLLEEEKSKGVLSAEEYTKRRRALAQEEIGIATDASNAEVSIRQAANAKILAGLQRSKRDRDLATKEKTNEAQIGLARDELDPNISDERLAVKSAEVNLTSTRSELSNAKTELEELNKAFASGALNQEQYNDRAAELKGSISDLGVKEAQGELAVRKAINAELLKQYERARATRELEARVANNAGRSALLNRQLRGPRKLESEDVAIESAKLDSAATDRQTANAQKDLADLREQFAKGLIKVGEFEDKSKELKGTLSDLGVQKLTNELAILEAQNAKTLKSFERLNAEANAKLEVRTFTRSDNAKRTQFQTGEVVGLGGSAEQSAIERDAISQRIKLREGEIAGIKRLVSQRVLTESEGRDRILGIEADIRSQKTSLLDSEIAEYTRAMDGKIAAVKRAADVEQRAFDKQKAQLQQQTTLIEKQSSLLNARKELASAVSSGRIAALEGRGAELGEQRNLAARLREGNLGRNETRETRRQLGISNDFQRGPTGKDELALLDRQQTIAREIENEKLSALEEQQKFARDSLKLEERRLEIAQKIAEIEARSGELAAKSANSQAVLELAKAKRTGDRDQIAAAEDNVSATSQQVALAEENTKAVQELGSLGKEESQIRRKTLGVQQRTELEGAYRDSNASEGKRMIERAALRDTLGGLDSPLYDRNPIGLRPTSEATNKALYSDEGDMATDNEKYQSEQLQTMKAMLQVAIETSKKLDKPTVNNFNAGMDSVGQYIAMKEAEQAAKARG